MQRAPGPDALERTCMARQQVRERLRAQTRWLTRLRSVGGALECNGERDVQEVMRVLKLRLDRPRVARRAPYSTRREHLGARAPILRNPCTADGVTGFPSQPGVCASTFTARPSVGLDVPAIPPEVAIWVGRGREGAVLNVHVRALECGEGGADCERKERRGELQRTPEEVERGERGLREVVFVQAGDLVELVCRRARCRRR